VARARPGENQSWSATPGVTSSRAARTQQLRPRVATPPAKGTRFGTPVPRRFCERRSPRAIRPSRVLYARVAFVRAPAFLADAREESRFPPSRERPLRRWEISSPAVQSPSRQSRRRPIEPTATRVVRRRSRCLPRDRPESAGIVRRYWQSESLPLLQLFLLARPLRDSRRPCSVVPKTFEGFEPLAVIAVLLSWKFDDFLIDVIKRYLRRDFCKSSRRRRLHSLIKSAIHLTLQMFRNIFWLVNL